MRKGLYIFILLLLLVMVGCSGKEKDESKESLAEESREKTIQVLGKDYPLIVVDAIGNETVIDEKPERVAVLSGTPLNIWYDLGGKSICTSDVTDNLKIIEGYEEEILSLPMIGPVYSIDMESVISMEPDLIISQLGTQSQQAKRLKDMGYKVINTHIRSYEDVKDSYLAFGKILDNEILAEEKIEEKDRAIEEIVSSLPDEDTRVVVLYVTSRSLAVKLDNSIAGDIARILNLENIASNLPPDTIGSENTPIDIEYIVSENPDYVLVTSMVSNNQLAIEMMEEEFATNPAWKGVNAIKEGRVIYLPQEYFLYNAGPYYVEAIEYMARQIYPENY